MIYHQILVIKRIENLPVKMVELVNPVLDFSINHIKITTEVQNSHHRASPEV